MEKEEHYIPPLSHDWLTPLYDSVIPAILPEIALKRRLIVQARVEKDQHVLDLGARTATLTIMIKQAYPGAGSSASAPIRSHSRSAGRKPPPRGYSSRLIMASPRAFLNKTAPSTAFSRA